MQLRFSFMGMQELPEHGQLFPVRIHPPSHPVVEMPP